VYCLLMSVGEWLNGCVYAFLVGEGGGIVGLLFLCAVRMA
jgi:hypothetical protein